MPDTAKIISLLERLSVVAPERCHLREGYSWEKESQRPNPPLMEWMLLVTYRSCPAIKEYRQTPENGWRAYPEFILMAVLEEAHARGWEWSLAWCFGMDANTPARRAYRLYPRDYDYFTLERPIAEVTEPKEDGILEREVLPRLEALVLALESQS